MHTVFGSIMCAHFLPCAGAVDEVAPRDGVTTRHFGAIVVSIGYHWGITVESVGLRESKAGAFLFCFVCVYKLFVRCRSLLAQVQTTRSDSYLK